MGFSEFKPRLSKLRGQHFLADPCIIEKIIAASELKNEDRVLEVGPGGGALTQAILPRVSSLVAVEVDPLLSRGLREKFGKDPRFSLVEADILKTGAAALEMGDSYKLLTNLPYNITSAFLKKFLTESPLPERIVIMLQKEVAERITLGANSQKLKTNISSGMLGLMCNLYAECSNVCKVPASAFSPPPKVDSAVIMLKPYSKSVFAEKWGFERESAENFLFFAHRFFLQPRKKMAGILPKPQGENLRKALASLGENPDSRPAVLSLEKWVELWKDVNRDRTV